MSGTDPSAVVGPMMGAMILCWIVAIVVGLAGTVFWIVELIDVARRQFYDPNTKIVWVLVILFTHLVGSLIYYFAGKNMGYLPGERPIPRSDPGTWPPPPGPPTY